VVAAICNAVGRLTTAYLQPRTAEVCGVLLVRAHGHLRSNCVRSVDVHIGPFGLLTA
jgi:hypothetical protein